MPLTTFVASFSYSRNAFFESVRTSENFNVFFFALEIVEIALLSKEISEIKKH